MCACQSCSPPGTRKSTARPPTNTVNASPHAGTAPSTHPSPCRAASPTNRHRAAGAIPRGNVTPATSAPAKRAAFTALSNNNTPKGEPTNASVKTILSMPPLYHAPQTRAPLTPAATAAPPATTGSPAWRNGRGGWGSGAGRAAEGQGVARGRQCTD